MSIRFCIIWLKIASIITVIIGLISAAASYPATSGPWLLLFDLLKWPIDGNPSSFNADTRAVNAVLGGVMVGWGLFMFLLSTETYMTTIQKLPRIMFTALLAWFFVDSAGSFLAGLPGNIVLNVVFLVAFAPPLLLIMNGRTRG